MPHSDPTYIGQIASVTGAIIRIRLREDMPSTLIMIGGESYRVGQIMVGSSVYPSGIRTFTPFAHRSVPMLLRLEFLKDRLDRSLKMT